MLGHSAFRFIQKTSPLIVLAMLASAASPQSERSDYDVDKDGLIEIRKWWVLLGKFFLARRARKLV